jgi:leucyl aminopeptidase (aminopeptidase T)
VGIAAQELLPYNACSLGGNAFLPPAEISEELDRSTATGRIVADITVGELRFDAELIDPLGIVDAPVEIVVENGQVVDIRGGEIARRLKAGLDRLDHKLQVVVELGHGLSDLAPTRIIGVDESMNGTCHFGIGGFEPYHVDVVVRDPKIEVLN